MPVYRNIDSFIHHSISLTIYPSIQVFVVIAVIVFIYLHKLLHTVKSMFFPFGLELNDRGRVMEGECPQFAAVEVSEFVGEQVGEALGRPLPPPLHKAHALRHVFAEQFVAPDVVGHATHLLQQGISSGITEICVLECHLSTWT